MGGGDIPDSLRHLPRRCLVELRHNQNRKVARRPVAVYSAGRRRPWRRSAPWRIADVASGGWRRHHHGGCCRIAMAAAARKGARRRDRRWTASHPNRRRAAGGFLKTGSALEIATMRKAPARHALRQAAQCLFYLEEIEG